MATRTVLGVLWFPFRETGGYNCPSNYIHKIDLYFYKFWVIRTCLWAFIDVVTDFGPLIIDIT